MSIFFQMSLVILLIHLSTHSMNILKFHHHIGVIIFESFLQIILAELGNFSMVFLGVSVSFQATWKIEPLVAPLISLNLKPLKTQVFMVFAVA